MAYRKDQPFNDLPNLPSEGFTESPEILRQLAKASRYLGKRTAPGTALKNAINGH